MRNLLRYVLKNYAFLLFLLLEVVAFVLIFNYNSYQRATYLNSSNRITASIYNSYNSVVTYFGLAEVNQKLAEENARLREFVSRYSDQKSNNQPDLPVSNNDSLNYRFISAKIINNSVNNQHNYITLNKGRKDGVKVDQGVLNSDGVVGVITNVSESFSMGFSLLNKRWGVSAKHARSGTFGPISWDGNDFRFVNLNGIPFHVELAIGDTIVTSSYSLVFPEGLFIGIISSFEQPPGENYYQIKIKLGVDFKSLSYVHIVDNQNKEEISGLEKLKMDDPVSN